MKLCECGCGQPTRISPRTDRRAGHVRGEPLRFIHRHATTRKRPAVDEQPASCACGCGELVAVHRGVSRRFAHGHNSSKRVLSALDYVVSDRGYETPCWIWRHALNHGRGHVTISGRKTLAYAAMYEQTVGPIPQGCGLHHLCEVPACVRPDHLQPMTQGEHARFHGLRHNNLAGHNLGRH